VTNVRRILTAAATAIALAGLFTATVGAGPGDPPYSPKDVFSPENSAVIYADCPNAHEAADFLAKHADTTTPDEAVGAQQFFLNCASETRATYDTSVTRYLLLALAAATYIEAKSSTGDRHADAMKRGLAALAKVLPRPAGPALRNSPLLTAVSQPAPNPNTMGSGARPPTTTSQHLIMNGARPSWKFAPLADSLEAAYDAMVHADQLATAAHP
jgi:hypothetical protein